MADDNDKPTNTDADKPIDVIITNLDVGIRHCHTLRGQEIIPVGGSIVTKVTKAMAIAIADDSPMNDDGDPMFDIRPASPEEVRGTAPAEKPLEQMSLTALKKIAKAEDVDVSQATTAAEYADAINAKRATPAQ